jgi:hypothetical protein
MICTELLLKYNSMIENFLGINITHRFKPDSSVMITTTQIVLIYQPFKKVGLIGDQVMHKKTPAAKDVLQRNSTATPFDTEWHYHFILGKLNFLVQNTRLDISMAVHMCARFINYPNRIHQDAVQHVT